MRKVDHSMQKWLREFEEMDAFAPDHACCGQGALEISP
jgi:hypothetical protein